MIKDIGTEGLSLDKEYEPEGIIVDEFNKGGVAVLPEGFEMEMIDVTGIDGGELYIDGFSGKAMIGRMAESTGPR